MNKEQHILLAIHITDRMKDAPQVQKVFSQYGCSIRTRLGLHHTSEEYCSKGGLIILEMLDKSKEVFALKKELDKIKGIETKKIVFGH